MDADQSTNKWSTRKLNVCTCGVLFFTTPYNEVVTNVCPSCSNTRQGFFNKLNRLIQKDTPLLPSAGRKVCALCIFVCSVHICVINIKSAVSGVCVRMADTGGRLPDKS